MKLRTQQMAFGDNWTQMRSDGLLKGRLEAFPLTEAWSKVMSKRPQAYGTNGM